MEACVDLKGPRANPLAMHRSWARACANGEEGVCTPCGMVNKSHGWTVAEETGMERGGHRDAHKFSERQ